MPVDGTPFGNYTLLQLVARGGMAEIHLARAHGVAGFEKLVVIKRILPELMNDPEHVTMFLDEGRLAARLSHSNIVQVLDLGRVDDQLYLAMEWVAGLTVAQVASKCFQRHGGLPLEITLGLMSQACAGLHAAHEATFPDGRPMNVVHRDVSPHNLIVTFEGVVKVVDFGIAKSEDRMARTRTGFVKGRFSYMSPEQCRAQPVDRRTDVFALGVILHELATGRRLFRRKTTYETYKAIVDDTIPTPSAVRPGLPTALDRAVMRALEKDANRRTPTAGALQDDIEGALHQLGRSVGAPIIAHFLEDRLGDDIRAHTALLAELAESNATAVNLQGTGIYTYGEGDDGEEVEELELEVSGQTAPVPQAGGPSMGTTIPTPAPLRAGSAPATTVPDARAPEMPRPAQPSTPLPFRASRPLPAVEVPRALVAPVPDDPRGSIGAPAPSPPAAYTGGGGAAWPSSVPPRMTPPGMPIAGPISPPPGPAGWSGYPPHPYSPPVPPPIEGTPVHVRPKESVGLWVVMLFAAVLGFGLGLLAILHFFR